MISFIDVGELKECQWAAMFSLVMCRMKNNLKVVKNDHKNSLTSHAYALRFNVSKKSLKSFSD